MDQNVSPTQQAPSNSSPKSSSFLLRSLIIFVVIVVAGTGGYLIKGLSTNQERPLAAEESSSKTAAVTPIVTGVTPDTKIITTPSNSQSEQEWVRTNSLGMLSYEYPKGWHVAELWGQYISDGVALVMDKNPISTAPRDGTLDEIRISIINGLQNPESTNQNNISLFKKDLQSIQSDTVTSQAGPVTHIKGTTSMYEQQTPVEGYFLLVPSSVITDKVNYVVVKAIINPNSPNAKVLRHVMETLQK